MNDLLKLLAAIATKQRGHRYIIDRLENYEDWYLWFDAELDEENPKPGTCDIHLQRIGTSTKDADDGFRVLADAKYYGVLRFLAAIGVNHLPEKSRKAYYEVNLSPLRTEVDQ